MRTRAQHRRECLASCDFQVFLKTQSYLAVSPQVADPTELITALQLDHSVQQDGHEFMKLLLTVLGSRLASLPGAGDAAQVVPRLFCGRSSYTTTCEGCKRMSASSMKAVDFYELELSVCVRGETSLKASLGQVGPTALRSDAIFTVPVPLSLRVPMA